MDQDNKRTLRTGALPFSIAKPIDADRPRTVQPRSQYCNLVVKAFKALPTQKQQVSSVHEGGCCVSTKWGLQTNGRPKKRAMAHSFGEGTIHEGV